MTDRKIRLVYLFTGLVFIAILGTSIVQIFAAYMAEKDSLYETTLQRNYEMAQQKSVDMNSLFRSMRKSLQVTADYISGLHSTDSLQKQLDFYLNSNNYFNSVFVVGIDGIFTSISPASIGLANTKITTEATKKALEARAPTISEPYVSQFNRIIVLLTHPMYNAAGEYIGFLGATIYLQQPNILNDIFVESKSGDSGSYSYVVDNSGTLIFHPEKARIGDNAKDNKVIQKAIQGKSGHEEVVNTRGIAFLAGYAPVDEIGWGIVVQTPVAEIGAKTKKLLSSAVLYSLPLFLIILCITILLANRLAAPFASLSETARKLLSGQRVEDLPVPSHWNYEAHHLNKTILLTINTLQKQADQFSNEAQTDPLTGLANRRALEARLACLAQERKPFSVIVMDIDHFKKVNDTFGHPMGDEVLIYLAKILLAQVGIENECCRFGGEEFVILLPEASLEQAYRTAEKVRKVLEKEASPTGQPITVSLGAASCPMHAIDAKEVMQLADRALYAAKKSGRNRTVTYNSSISFT